MRKEIVFPKKPSYQKPTAPSESNSSRNFQYDYLQSKFFKSLIKDEKEVTIEFNDGDKIKGLLVAYDCYSILVNVGSKVEFIFKHSLKRIIHSE